jgi:hypothetical protein
MSVMPSIKDYLVISLILTNLLLVVLIFYGFHTQLTPIVKDSSDTNLLDQAELLTERIVSVEEITPENVVEAAQLWREAELTLEAVLSSGNKQELVNLSQSSKKLQKSLAEVIPKLVKNCYIKANNEKYLKNRLTLWAGAGAFLALFPNEGTPEAAEAAQSMGYEHERVRQKFLQLAQAKYNLWACEQIRKAWLDIKDANSPLWQSDNKKFYHTCIHFFAPIDSSLLDMSTGELYREVLHFVRERMPMEDFQEMAMGIQKGNKLTLDDCE